MKFSLRLLYLYLFSFVGLIIVIVASIGLVNLGMKIYLFPESDYYDTTPVVSPEGKYLESTEEAKLRQSRDVKRQHQNQLMESISAIIIGLPVYLYHWKTIQKEKLA